ncbi:Alpha/beta hydrolase family protein [compost metagenome]
MSGVNSHSFTLDAGQTQAKVPLQIRGDIRVRLEDASIRKPILIVSHGFKGFKDWGLFPYAASRFAEANFYVITFNFSCNGVGQTDFDELEKFAVNTYSREQADLALLIQAIEQGILPHAEYADSSRIYLLGHSRGGGNSLIFAADQPQIGKVVTWNGNAKADLFDDAFKAHIAEYGVAYVSNARTQQDMPIRAVFYEDLKINQERFDIVKRLKQLRIPVLQVQGLEDSPRLKAGFELLKAGAPEHAVVEIPGANHTFGAVHPFVGTTPYLEEVIELTIEFLQKNE